MRYVDATLFVRCLFDDASDAILVFESPDTRVIDANAAAERLTGCRRRDLLQTMLNKLVTAEVRSDASEPVAVWLNAGLLPASAEWSVNRTDGTLVPVDIEIRRFDPPLDSLGVAILRDASGRKQAEAALERRAVQFRELFLAAPDAVFIEDLEGHVLDVNPAACHLHGCGRDDLIGKHVLELIPPNHRKKARRDFNRLVARETDCVEGYSLARDGRSVPVELRVAHIDYGGRPALLLHVRDVTERSRSDREARQSAAALARTSRLSPREHQVMERVVAGRVNREIAEELGISVKTVECHRANMMRKLGVDSLPELVKLVLTAAENPDPVPESQSSRR